MYNPKENYYVVESELEYGLLGVRYGNPGSHIYGNPAIIYLSKSLNDDEKKYVALHEKQHREDEYQTRVITSCLAIDLYGIYNSPITKYHL